MHCLPKFRFELVLLTFLSKQKKETTNRSVNDFDTLIMEFDMHHILDGSLNARSFRQNTNKYGIDHSKPSQWLTTVSEDLFIVANKNR